MWQWGPSEPNRACSKPASQSLSKRILEKGGVMLKAADLRAPPKSSAREKLQRRQVRSSNEDIDYQL
jgi:hypothetical protein